METSKSSSDPARMSPRRLASEQAARGAQSLPVVLAPRTLGWLSVALGAMAAGAPALTSRLLGTPQTRLGTGIVRAVGVRELAVGAGYLTRAAAPSRLSWLRVAGDALDLSLLAGALGSRRTHRPRLLASLAIIASVAAVDAMAAVRQRRALSHA